MKLDDAQCPECGSKNVATRSLQLHLAHVLSRLTKRILRVRAKCANCGTRFSHVHQLLRTVVGYHGCSQQFAAGLVTGRISLDEWKASQNPYDWLGKGIYFWEHARGRAWQWAREHHGDDAAVVATEIQLGTCLDFGDTVFNELLLESYIGTLDLFETTGRKLPKNEGEEQKLRMLDRLIIDTLTDVSDDRGLVYQTVRCPFEEGETVYPGGIIREQSHIQIAVRDKACISSRLFLVDPLEGDRDQSRTG